MTNTHMKRCSASLAIKEMEINTLSFHQMGNSEKDSYHLVLVRVWGNYAFSQDSLDDNLAPFISRLKAHTTGASNPASEILD